MTQHSSNTHQCQTLNAIVTHAVGGRLLGGGERGRARHGTAAAHSDTARTRADMQQNTHARRSPMMGPLCISRSISAPAALYARHGAQSTGSRLSGELETRPPPREPTRKPHSGAHKLTCLEISRRSHNLLLSPLEICARNVVAMRDSERSLHTTRIATSVQESVSARVFILCVVLCSHPKVS